MRVITLVGVLFLAGCGSGPIDLHANPIKDSGIIVDSGDASRPELCCQITDDLTDSSLWQNKTYGCGGDQVPWICGSNQSCTDPGCNTGMSCIGFNGTGRVIECPK